MIKKYYEEICARRDIRQNLIFLRQELKSEENRRALAYLLRGDFSIFISLLQEEDPKIRKNAARILGDMETEDVLPFLFAAYQREKTLFVRADYLKAMENLDYRLYLKKLKDGLEELRKTERTEENRKHLQEEMSQLQSMILKYEKPKKHTFIGYEPAPEVLLITNRCQKAAVRAQISTGTVKELGVGLRIKGGDLRELLRVRTYSELLFLLPGSHALSGSPEDIGRGLAKLGLAEFIRDMHKSGGCFYFRIEIKGAMPLDQRGHFIRKVSAALEEGCAGELRNNAADYEVELRLLERKDGSFFPLLKLYTLPDTRFAYRKEVIAASISPVNAALTVQLAKKYLKENAQILDPFCGVGTMLLERNKAVPADPMYGVDIFGEAIEKARENAKRDGSIVHYINRDFFDFTHKYLFDEIITDMPRAAAGMDMVSLADLYHRFFERAPQFLNKEAVMVLYTMNPELVDNGIASRIEYEKLEQFSLSDKNRTSVFVLRVKR